MSVIQNNLLLTGDDAYNLTRSLRFRSSASSYLNRTPASAGNRKTWTYSTWVKRGALGSNSRQMLTAGYSTNPWFILGFTSNDVIEVAFTAGTSNGSLTTAVFRDPSAWYHVVLAIDTTQATAANRVKLYVNNVQQTFASTNYPAQNTDFQVNNTVSHTIGGYSGEYFDGYLTEVNFIDGQALTPSSFGENNAQTGVWQPKRYTGTYGTNGFYLPFTDNSTTTTLGNDFSGNGNNWTTNNISLANGATYDSMTDVPTLTSATASNFAVLNPLDKGGNITLSAANLNYSTGATNMVRATMQIPSTGKWYWECTQTSSNSEQFGIATASASTGTYLGGDANGWSYGGSGNKFNNNSSSAYGASFTNGDVIGVAFDADAGTLTFYKNNVSQGTAFSSLTGSYFPAVGGNLSSGVINFGQRPFAYTPPTGFVALNTYNLPTPTIGATLTTPASKFFNVGTYTGTGSSSPLAVAGADTPDLVWIKVRSQASSHSLLDKLRDSADPFSLRLYSSGTNAEYDYGSSLLTPTSTGFNLTTSDADHNSSGQSYVAWQWKANGTGVTNTAGSITSTVSANTSAGFSVVTYTGNGSAGATIGHGLGVAPKMIIVKRRDGSVDDWCVYHVSIGNTGRVRLNTTAATQTNILFWNNTSPASTVFTVGADSGVNTNGATYVAYCFAEVAGYSKFGSYTGNGSSDGPFVYTGFRPKFVLIKSSSYSAADTHWHILDTSRDIENPQDKYLNANTSGAEDTYTFFDMVSNGFKFRQSGSSFNGSGTTYIYMAFAENPYKYSLAR